MNNCKIWNPCVCVLLLGLHVYVTRNASCLTVYLHILPCRHSTGNESRIVSDVIRLSQDCDVQFPLSILAYLRY